MNKLKKLTLVLLLALSTEAVSVYAEEPDDEVLVIPVVNIYEESDNIVSSTQKTDSLSHEDIVLSSSDEVIVDEKYVREHMIDIQEISSLDVPIINAHSSLQIEDVTSSAAGTEVAVKFEAVFPFQQSLFYSMTSGFGFRPIFGGYSFHTGIDLTSYQGEQTDITTITDGTVIETHDGCANGEFTGSGLSPGCEYGGNYVRILSDYPAGENTTIPVIFSYLHLSPYTMTVSAGDHVYSRESLGKMGDSGISTGTHLHFSASVLPKDIDVLEKITGRSLRSGISDIFDQRYMYIDPAVFLSWR